ncbi:MAG: hypothetical protein CVT88_05725 [Candidatus Altiarchaeales archaeon HGW-Altiarchaeales-1]|nr:MAG: hypothetical protein CVT88_05725 [Candidatus Altiarchaeales archaeon HGW-Altiarchaeales-1]
MTYRKITTNPFKHEVKKNIIYRTLDRLLNRIKPSKRDEIHLNSLLQKDFELAKSKILNPKE